MKERMEMTGRQAADGGQKKRVILEIAMAALFPFLMAYSLAGAALHEFGGMALAVLYGVHCVSNRGWFKNLQKGTYTAARTVNVVTDLLLLADMVILMVSGIMISHHAATFLSFGDGVPFWYALHQVGAYWGFVLMAVHLGFHGRMLAEGLGIRNDSRVGSVLRAVLIAVSAYGVFAAGRRELVSFLLLRQPVAEAGESLALFLADYVSMMVLIAVLAYYGLKALKVEMPKATLIYAKARKNAQ